MFWNGCVFEVAVATGISLKDWKLSKFWQLSHFSFTVIHHCITIRRARTHCCRGKRGSSANRGTSSAVGGAQVMRKHWCGHTSFVEVLSASYFNNPLPLIPTTIHIPHEIILRLIRLSKRLSCSGDPTPFGFTT